MASSTSVSLTEIHQLVGGELHGDGSITVSALAGLADADARSLSFVGHDKALKTSGTLRAGALLVYRYLDEIAVPQIVVGNPQLAFAQVAQRFFVHPVAPRGIAAEVIQGTGVRIGAQPSIWPFVTLGDCVTIGARVTLFPGVFVGADSTIGDDTVLYPNVVVREGCSIGARVIVHSGTVIGADGFGYLQQET